MHSFAEATFKIQAVQKDGASLLTHLENVEKQTKYSPPELQAYRKAILPSKMSGYWYDFLELSERREFGEVGPEGITHTMLRHWAENNNITLNTFQQDMIFALDRLYLKSYYENKKQNRK